MNRHLALALSVLAGVALGAGASLRPARASTTTLYGSVATPGIKGSVPITVELRDPRTDRVVSRVKAVAAVRDGRYTAEFETNSSDGLYLASIAGPNNEVIQSATFVELQSNTPGTKQTGNVNISGTLLAGKIGVPVINAGAMINAQGSGGVIGLRGQSDGTGVVGSSTSAAGAGISGNATAPAGTSSGVIGFNSSPDGFGVRGIGGPGVGVKGQTSAANLPGVEGIGQGFGGRFSSSAIGSFAVHATALGEKTTGVLGQGNTGVQGVGLIGVDGIGEITGGSFESTREESTALEGKSDASFATGVLGEALGNGGTGVRGNGSQRGGLFTSSGTDVAGIVGDARGAGIPIGGDFVTNGTEGRGVRGRATAVSGANFGGWFTSASPSGTGAVGTVVSATGNTVGLYGTVNSSSGKGVFGEATSATGNTFGGDFVSNSTTGTGLRARNTALTGLCKAAEFSVASPNGQAILASATASNGTGFAIQANTSGSGGAAGTFAASSSTGSTIGVRAQVASTTGRAVFAQHFPTNTNVELASGNGAVVLNKGHVVKQFNANFFPITPLAYGMVSATGARLGGTGNFSCFQIQNTKAYVIHLTTNEELADDDFSIQVQQFGSISAARLNPIVDFESQDRTSFVVHWETAGGADASTKFMFTVFGRPLPPPTGP